MPSNLVNGLVLKVAYPIWLVILKWKENKKFCTLNGRPKPVALSKG